MKNFLDKHAERVSGTISCFDRLIFKGYLPLTWPRAMEKLMAGEGLKIKDFMYTPEENEYVEENATLDAAIHVFIMGHHHSLLVTRDEEIVGILMLPDVFKEICEHIKTCEL